MQICCILLYLFYNIKLYKLQRFCEAGFANENYRFFLFLIMLAVMASLPLDFDKLSKLCLWCCKMHILFTLYEFTYINLLALGDYDGIFLVGKAMASYDVDSQYLRESDNLGLMAIRPFGLMYSLKRVVSFFVSESSFSTLEIDFLIVISLIYGTFFLL